jgi:hypothetical protein
MKHECFLLVMAVGKERRCSRMRSVSSFGRRGHAWNVLAFEAMGMLFEGGLAGRVLAWADISTPVKVRLIARVVVGLVEFGGWGCGAKLMGVGVGVGRDRGRQRAYGR